MRDKVAFIYYNGGVRSYLMLRYALDNGYYPILFFLNAGRKNFEYFRIPNVYNVLKKNLSGYPYIEVVKKADIDKFINLDEDILVKLSNKIKKIKDGVIYFFMDDLEIDEEIKNKMKKNMIKVFKLKFFSNIYNKIKKNKKFFDGVSYIPIAVKKESFYKLGKRYTLARNMEVIEKKPQRLSTLVISAKHPKIKLRYRVVSKENYYDSYRYLSIDIL